MRQICFQIYRTNYQNLPPKLPRRARFQNAFCRFCPRGSNRAQGLPNEIASLPGPAGAAKAVNNQRARAQLSGQRQSRWRQRPGRAPLPLGLLTRWRLQEALPQEPTRHRSRGVIATTSGQRLPLRGLAMAMGRRSRPGAPTPPLPTHPSSAQLATN